MRVAAIVVSWNSAAHLPACLAALDDQDHDAFEVVVVDNASADTSRKIVEAALGAVRRHPLRLVVNGENRGFAGGVNDGLAVLGPDVDAVLLVNPDVVAHPRLVTHCAAALAADPHVGSVQPRLVRPRPSVADQAVIDTTGHVLTTARIVLNRGEGEPDDERHATSGEVFGASGACVLHRRSMLDDVAWDGREVLTESLVAYFDDVDLDWRARRRGWSAWYAASATAVHERGGAGPRRTTRVEALNWSNHLLVTVSSDRVAPRHVPLVVAVWVLKTVELAATVPGALAAGVRRLRLLPDAVGRRHLLVRRDRVTVDEVVATWAVPLDWRDWVATWWRRRREPRQPSSS